MTIEEYFVNGANCGVLVCGDVGRGGGPGDADLFMKAAK